MNPVNFTRDDLNIIYAALHFMYYEVAHVIPEADLIKEVGMSTHEAIAELAIPIAKLESFYDEEDMKELSEA